MRVYYNEWDKYAADWLKILITAGHLPEGDVDDRDIRTIQTNDLKGYDQCHFFAGIGGWPLALKLAGWGDRPVWTGSCPCQPYSAAGKASGQQDERHLWPDWYRLIAKSKPPTIFGEQVANAITFGWWDDVATDLEKEGYACAAAVLPACSVGAPHKRDRLWFVANAYGSDTMQDGSSHKTSAEERTSLQTSRQKRQCTPILGSGLFNLQNVTSNTDNIGCEGESKKSLQQNKTEPLEFTGSFEGFNGGWDISAPQVCGVDDGVSRVPSKLRAYGNAIVP